MSKLIGTGILKKDGQEQKVQVCLNLDDNVIEVYQITPSEERFKKLETFSQHSNNINLQGITLMNVRLISPMGIIKTDSLPDCFISIPKMGGWRYIESEILNVMNEDDLTMTKMILKPYCSKIQFNFDPFVPDYLEDRCYEIIYDGAKNMNLVRHINIHLNSDHQLIVSGDKGRFIVKSCTPLSDYEEIIRIGLGILLGGPISVRYIYDGESKTITINLANHEGKTIGPLYCNRNGEKLLNMIFNYLFHEKLVGDNRADSYDNNWKRLTRGLYFYLQGLGGIAPIEIRVINLFTFLEIIDESNTLDKNKISKLLDITTDEADILCKTRGSLIHNGKDIATALINSYNEIASRKKDPLDCKLFIIDSDNKQKMTEHFYFKLAMLLNKFLMKEIGYSGQWNDYSDYLNTKNNECDSH